MKAPAEWVGGQVEAYPEGVGMTPDDVMHAAIHDRIGPRSAAIYDEFTAHRAEDERNEAAYTLQEQAAERALVAAFKVEPLIHKLCGGCGRIRANALPTSLGNGQRALRCAECRRGRAA